MASAAQLEELIKGIRDRFEGRKALNISAVKRDAPELLTLAYSPPKPLGWRRALRMAKLSYESIQIEWEEEVACAICGEWKQNLTHHLKCAHALSGEEYTAEFPRTFILSERLRANISRKHWERRLKHGNRLTKWPLLEPRSKESLIDRILWHWEAGRPVNYTAIAESDLSLLVGCNLEFGSYKQALEAAGLDPRSVALIRRCDERLLDELVDAALDLATGPQDFERVQEFQRRWAQPARRMLGSIEALAEIVGVPVHRFRCVMRYPDRVSVEHALESRHQKGESMRPADVQRDDPTLYSAIGENYESPSSALAPFGYKPLRRFDYSSKDKVTEGIRERIRAGLGLSDKAIAGKPDEGGNQMLRIAARREFGSWRAALIAAGIDPSAHLKEFREFPTRESVIAAIQMRVKNEIGVRHRDMVRGSHRKDSLLKAGRKLFGSWDSALIAAGQASKVTTPKRYPTKESVIEEIVRQNSGLSVTSMTDGALYKSARAYFGEWYLALEAAGISVENGGRSQPDMALEVLKSAGHPLDIEEILAGIESKFGCRPERHSLASAIGKWAAKNKHFRRVGFGTYTIAA